MTELLYAILGGWIRAGLIALSTYLVQRHLVTGDQGQQLVQQLFTHTMIVAPAVVALVWTTAAKIVTDTRNRLKVLVALYSPVPKESPK